MSASSYKIQEIEGIPVPVGLVVEWDHHRWVKPVYYGDKPRLLSLAAIRNEHMQHRLMSQGGMTTCRIFEVAADAKELLHKEKVPRETLYCIADADVICSEDDNYVKSVGRKRSLSKALSIYHAVVGTRERKFEEHTVAKGEIGRFTPASPLNLDPLDPPDMPYGQD